MVSVPAVSRGVHTSYFTWCPCQLFHVLSVPAVSRGVHASCFMWCPCLLCLRQLFHVVSMPAAVLWLAASDPGWVSWCGQQLTVGLGCTPWHTLQG